MKTIKVSKREMKHTSRGVFQYINKKPVKMLKGGHGERNINYPKKNELVHQINVKKKDHAPMYGKYKKVYVVTYKAFGRICGICPNFKQEK